MLLEKEIRIYLQMSLLDFLIAKNSKCLILLELKKALGSYIYSYSLSMEKK